MILFKKDTSCRMVVGKNLTKVTRTKNKRGEKFTNQLIYIVSIKGMMFHIGYIMIGYFLYETVTKTEIVVQDNIRPPALSICLNDHSFVETGNHTMIEFMNNTENFFADRIKNFPWHEIKTNREFYWSKGRKCMKVTTKDEFIETGKLWHVFSSVFFVYSDNNSSDMKNVHMYLHDRDSYPFDYDTVLQQAIIRDKITPMTPLILYDDVSMTYLGKPFSPDCKNYRGSNFTTRGHCTESCMNRLYKSRCLYTVHLENSFCYQAMNSKFEYKDQHRLDCFKSCSLECESRRYYPITLYVPNENFFSIKLYNNRPRTMILYSSKFPLYELLLYVASLIGLWLGCSFIGVLLSTKASVSQWLP